MRLRLHHPGEVPQRDRAGHGKERGGSDQADNRGIDDLDRDRADIELEDFDPVEK